MLRINHLLGTAFAAAVKRQSSTKDLWQTLADQLGGRLPNSLLIPSIQRCGRLDILVRCLEDERAQNHETSIVADDQLHMLSELWMGSIYAILYVLAKRLKADIAGLAELHKDTRLIRVGIEKHELPSDKSLEEPLTLQTYPDGSESREFVYDKADPLRAYIMPCKFAPNGSILWVVTDVKSMTLRTLSRRDISDRALALATQSDSLVGQAIAP